MTRKYHGNKHNIKASNKASLLIFDALNKAGVNGLTRQEILDETHISTKTFWVHMVKNHNGLIKKEKDQKGVWKYYLIEHYEQLDSLKIHVVWNKLAVDMLSWAKKKGLAPTDVSFKDFYSKHAVFIFPVKTDDGGFRTDYLFQNITKHDLSRLTNDISCE